MARKPSKPANRSPAKPGRVSDAAKAKLVRAALEKHKLGRTLTARELQALEQFERQREDDARRAHLTDVPKAVYLELASADSRTVHRHADRFGLPLRRSSIDLFDVITRLHRILDQYGPAIQAAATGDDPELVGENSPALERLREEKYRLARLDRLEREQTLVPRQQIRDGLATLAARLRQAGDQLGKRFGPDAQELLNEALDDFAQEIRQNLESLTPGAPTPDPTPDDDDAHQLEDQQPRDR